MAYSSRNQRMTIYDLMEAKGVFAANPANANSQGENGEPLYQGPVAYPKMFYHPEGQSRETNPGSREFIHGEWKVVGKQSEMISTIANNAEEEKALREEGWHDHPAKAIAAGGGIAPPMSSIQRIADLEAELERLTAEKNSAVELQAKNDSNAKKLSH